jgi:hypothetical protein
LEVVVVQKLIPVSEVADLMGLDRSNTRKWLLEQGFWFVSARDPESRQRVNALPLSEVRRAVNLRKELGFPLPEDRRDRELREVKPIA